ncbi:hypothetical protein AA313_de0206478 [Arthrobotrys entomopaga]|nr:hypothetical protein AA313_de0206478 [Arthrobotrys entomopaga]
MTNHTLTASQIEIIEAVQRASSALSIVGASFIILTFLLSPRFHKPINRLAFYAAIANILSTVATTISRAGPRAGAGSALCNMQGLFIQTFLQSDALFVAFMALNVYLTVNCKFSSNQLRKLEPWYVACAFGIPGLSGFIMIWARTPTGGPIYGDALLWCWISQEYDVLRLATFYGPTWIVILITLILYVLAGKTVFKMRNDLRRFDQKNHGAPIDPSRSTSQTALSSFAAPAGKSSSTGIQMTTVTQIDHTEQAIKSPAPIASTYMAGGPESYQYKVTIHAGQTPRQPSVKESEIDFYDSSHDVEGEDHDLDGDEFILHKRMGSVDSTAGSSSSSTKKPSLTPTEVTSAGIISPAVNMNKKAIAANRKTMKANAAAWAYTRCAFLFFVGLLITWLPSSTNRVYGFVHREDQVFALYLTAGMVLPAQGLWNFIIYLTTSWRSCKLMWRDISVHFSTGFLHKKPSIESIPRNRVKISS